MTKFWKKISEKFHNGNNHLSLIFYTVVDPLIATEFSVQALGVDSRKLLNAINNGFKNRPNRGLNIFFTHKNTALRRNRIKGFCDFFDELF